MTLIQMVFRKLKSSKYNILIATPGKLLDLINSEDVRAARVSLSIAITSIF
jgi:superfamily II DNA/RNA helicase